MYTSVSDKYKLINKSYSIISTARISVVGEGRTIDSTQLKDLTLKDFCYDEQTGELIGTNMAKVLEFTFQNKDNISLADKEISLELGLVFDWEKEEKEYLPIGNFIVTDYEDLKSGNQYKVLAYDYMIKFNPVYKIDESIYPCTLKEFYYNLCRQYGVEFNEQDNLPNEDFKITIDKAPAVEGMTGRNILTAIGQLFGRYAKINRNNQIEWRLTNEPKGSLYPSTHLYSGKSLYPRVKDNQQPEIIDGYSMNSKLQMNNKYGPVNSVTLSMSQVNGENVTLENKENIKENGECSVNFADNPFVYTEELREQAIQGLYTALYGFTYVPVEFNYKGRFYLDCGDLIKVENTQTGEFVDTILLNHTIKVPAARTSSISSKAMTSTAVKTKYISKTKQANTRTEINVYKNQQKIEAVVSSNTETVQKVAKLEETVDKISSQMSTSADVTKEAVDYGTISFDDVNQSEPIMIKIHPTGRPVKTLYPSDSLYPSDTLYPHEREIQFKLKADDYSDSNKSFKDIIEYNLPADLYYYDNETYDEFVLDYEKQKCYITRRTSYNTSTDTVSKLTIEQTENYDYPKINLESGNYIITMPAFPTAYIYIKLMGKNIYTSQFATHVEVSSAIEQTAQEINLEVKKKVGDDEIISKINQSAEEIKINADKIDIDGKAVHFKTEVNKHIGAYTQSDIDKIKEIIMKDTQSQEDIEKYDTNQNGTVDTNDWNTIQYAIKYNNGILDKTGYYEITPTDPNSFISIYDTTYNNMNSSKNKALITSLGLNDSKLNRIFTEGIDVVDVINEKMSVGTILSDSHISIGSTQISSNGDAGTFILGKNNNSMCLFIQGNQPYITLYDTNNFQLINIYPNRIEIGLSTEIGENIKIPGTAEFGGNTKIGGNAEISGTVTGINFTKSGYGNAMCGKEMGHEYYASWANDSELQFWVDDTRVGFASDVSDKRLKDDIEEVPDNFIKAVGECHTFQYKPKDKGGKIFIGIIAQDLIEKFNKYGVKDYKKYAILEKTKYKDNDPNLYYFLNYQQYAIIKNRYLELKLIEQQEEIETLKNEIKKLK